MDAARYARVRDLFNRALDQPESERKTFLRNACGADEALRAEVDSLLAEMEESGAFLESGTPGEAVRRGATAILDGEEVETEDRDLGTVGGYRILRLLGEGGMGSVYEAEQEKPRRRVALKVLRGWLLSPSALKRFEREAEILGRLNHPGIARIYEAGTETSDGPGGGPQPFLAMELVDGEPVTRWAEQEGRVVREKLSILAEICDAVHHAHTQGVVHRDLKPGNILVDSEGRPRILDFGVARVTDPDRRGITMMTAAGQILGTLAYMSPEQVTGRPEAVDARSDVYSLGVLAFRMLSGRLPVDLSDLPLAEAARRVQEEEPSHLSTMDRSLRGDVETIVGKALEKSPDRRYPTAAAMAADIRRHLASQPIRARPAGSLYQLGKFARRNRALVAAVVVAFLALLGGTLVASRMAYLAGAERRHATQESYRASLAAAAAALEEGDAFQARRYLEGAPEGLRGWEWLHLDAHLDISLAVMRGDEAEAFTQRFRERPAFTMRTTERQADQPVDRGTLRVRSETSGDLGPPVPAWLWPGGTALSPSGRTMARMGSQRWEVHLHEAWTGREIGVLDEPREDVTSLSLPDDRTLLTGSINGMVRLWDLEGMRLLKEQRVHRRGEVRAVAEEPGGRIIASAGADGTIRIWDGRLDQEMAVLHGHEGPVLTLDFDRDGLRLLTSSTDGTRRLWDVSPEGTDPGVLEGHESYVYPVAFHPEGRLLASGSWDRSIRIWDVASGRQKSMLSMPEGGEYPPQVFSLSWSPDGERLTAGLRSRTIALFDALGGKMLESRRLSDEVPFQVAFHPAGDAVLHCTVGPRAWILDPDTLEARRTLEGVSRPCAWSPDGERLAASDPSGNLVVLETATGRVLQRLEDRLEESVRLTWSPDGRLLVTAGRDGTATVWDWEAGDAIADLRTGSGPVYGLAWHPDGSRLVLGGDDGILRLFETRSWLELLQLRGHHAYVYSLDFSPDGRMLASGSGDGTVRIWSTRPIRVSERPGGNQAMESRR